MYDGFGDEDIVVGRREHDPWDETTTEGTVLPDGMQVRYDGHLCGVSS